MKIGSVFLIVMLIFVEERAYAGYCGVKMVNGKLEKFGDCDNKQQSQVLKDLDKKLENFEKTYPRSCKDVKSAKHATSGVFNVYLESLSRIVKVYCDLETDGGGWTVFQRRVDGSENFYRGWSDYVTGFGRKNKEFWLGLENLHQMTKNGNYELRVELEDFYGNTAYATYKSFSIGSSAGNYRLNVGSYNGTPGDALRYNNGRPFTTKDKDNDDGWMNCAVRHKGAWWFPFCGWVNLNGPYHDTVGYGRQGMWWWNWKNDDVEYLKSTEMKFRRGD